MTLLKMLGRGLLALVLLLGALWAAAIWQANRDVAPVPLAERQAHYQKALAYFKANEPGILMDGNTALWWMVQAAAEHTQDEYLLGLVREVLRRNFPSDDTASPFKRMIDPTAKVASGDLLNLIDIDQLWDYQKFYLHGTTCKHQPLAHGDTRRFLRENICRPIWREVWPRDPVCSTHHAIGISLFKRVGCPVLPETPQLAKDLLDDIAFQTRHDIVMRDAYIQHVMVLMWLGQPEMVKPVWLRRVLDAQLADGSWRGEKRYPFLPDAMQPGGAQRLLQTWWPSRFPTYPAPIEFHATAQGLLVAALSLPAHPKPQIGVAAN
jgi:hypothetical protein